MSFAHTQKAQLAVAQRDTVPLPKGAKVIDGPFLHASATIDGLLNGRTCASDHTCKSGNAPGVGDRSAAIPRTKEYIQRDYVIV